MQTRFQSPSDIYRPSGLKKCKSFMSRPDKLLKKSKAREKYETNNVFLPEEFLRLKTILRQSYAQ